MSLPLSDGVILITRALEQTIEDKLWQVWVSAYPHMDEKSYKSFDRFLSEAKQKQLQRSQPKITAEEVIAKAERIKQADQRQRKEGGDK